MLAAAALGGTGTAAGATCRVTPAQTEGPYYSPGAPVRRSLVPAGAPGRRLVLTGRVLDTSCRPVRGAVVDVWQADASGAYDNSGFRFRGLQRVGPGGRYRFLTVVPGEYPGRTVHIHLKVRAPGRPELTTQLYLPGVPANASDGIFDPRLTVRLTRGTPRTARADLVLG